MPNTDIRSRRRITHYISSSMTPRPLLLSQLYNDTSLPEKHQYWPPFRKAMSHFGTQDAMTVFERLDEYVDVVAQSHLKPATIKKNLSYIFHIYSHMTEEQQQCVGEPGLKKLCEAIGYKRAKAVTGGREEDDEDDDVVRDEVRDDEVREAEEQEGDDTPIEEGSLDNEPMSSMEFNLAKQYIHELEEKVTYLSDTVRTFKRTLEVQSALVVLLANDTSPRLLNRFLMKHRDLLAQIPSHLLEESASVT
jgi:hypothetical protein